MTNFFDDLDLSTNAAVVPDLPADFNSWAIIDHPSMRYMRAADPSQETEPKVLREVRTL